MSDNPWALELVAHAVVELGVPLNIVQQMSVEDEMYLALRKAWEDKEERIDRRNALLCCVTARSMGSDKVDIEDFMPRKPKTRAQEEAEIKAMLINYDSAQKRGR